MITRVFRGMTAEAVLVLISVLLRPGDGKSSLLSMSFLSWVLALLPW